MWYWTVLPICGSSPLVIIGLFLQYQLTNVVLDCPALWGSSPLVIIGLFLQYQLTNVVLDCPAVCGSSPLVIIGLFLQYQLTNVVLDCPALCWNCSLVTPYYCSSTRELVVCYVLYLFSMYYFVFVWVFCCLRFLGFPL